MSQTVRSSTARPLSRRSTILAVTSFAFAIAACVLVPDSSFAATARVRWLPSDGAVSHYDIYVRAAGAPYPTEPAWSGSPTPADDGALEALVTFTPSAAAANYFSVVAVSGAAQSGLSHELWTGTPLPCRADSCTTQTVCDFGDLPDGTSCGDGGGDPCAGMCLGGQCGAASGPGTDVTLYRLRFTTHASDVQLALKGRISTDVAVDPTASGATLELRASDGSVLYASSLDASAFETVAPGQRYHYGASSTDAAALSNGLTRLDFRRNGSQWIVTAEGRSGQLVDAVPEPALTVVLRLGTTCARELGASCDERPDGSVCR